MTRRKLAPGTVVLVPAREEDLRVGLTAGVDGTLQGLLTIRTARLGDFAIPLSATHLALVVAVGRRLLRIDESEADALLRELENKENPSE